MTSFINLTNLTTAQGFFVLGDAAGDSAGFSVSGAGDVNGDGIDDIIIGAPSERYGAGGKEGRAYVIYGKAGPARTGLDLAALTASDGFIIQGDTALDEAGRSVSGAGDINGDGIADLIIGAPSGDNGGDAAGEAYVIYGQTGATRGTLDLTSLAIADGFIIQGDARFDGAGGSVSGAGDINGDGIDDLIVGAQYGDDGGGSAGEAYVIYGKSGTARNSVDLTGLTPGDGFIVQGDAMYDRAGGSVSSAGDVNGDGIDDFIVSAVRGSIGGSRVGQSYVIFGKTGATRGTLDLTGLSAADGFTIAGGSLDYGLGGSVSGAGDFNGDGFDDIIIGSNYNGAGGSNAGAAYVIFGKANPDARINVGSLTAVQGFIIQGDTAGDKTGISVSSVGDLNGDGFDDLIIGANLGDSSNAEAGQAYIIFGKAGATGTNIDLTDLTAAQGYIIQGDSTVRGGTGFSVSGAGDVNGDGTPDVILGSPLDDRGGLNAGVAHIVYGNAPFSPPLPTPARVINVTSLSPSQGYAITPFTAGAFDLGGVAGVQDVNGDGIDDIIIGTSEDARGGNGAGGATIVFGTDNAPGTMVALSTLSPARGFFIQGDAANDRAGRSVSSAGDINGDGIGDIIVGARYGDNGGSDAGEAYVIYGTTGATGTNIDLTTLTLAQGFIIQGDISNDRLGVVSSAGDVNGDGFDDLLVAATHHSYERGAVYVIYGTGAPLAANIDLTTITAQQGFRVRGPSGLQYRSEFGVAISAAGDLNADGYDDIVIGAPSFSRSNAGNFNDFFSGQTYVIFGAAGTSRGEIDVTTLTGSNGFRILGDHGAQYPLGGSTTGDRLGSSVVSIGDINGDGIDDLFIGASYDWSGGNYSGGGVVIYGKTGATRGTIDTATFTAADGFLVQGSQTFDQAGTSVASAGDINGDGINDIMIGAPGASIGGVSQSGAVYVIFGTGGATRGNIDLSTLSVTEGLVFTGSIANAGLGNSIARAGDVNNDGFEDLLLNSNRQGAFIVFGGGNFAATTTITGTSSTEALTGTAVPNRIFGLDGDDVINGLGGDDVLVGGNGNDRLDGGADNDVLIAGTGSDVLLGGAGLNQLIGGTGDDLYIISATTDSVVELIGEGNDEIQTTLSSLINRLNVETLRFTDNGAHVGVGRDQDDILIGGTGRDDLFGRGGNDVLRGGSGAANALFGQGGDDIFYIDAFGDSAYENAGEGNDSVFTALDFHTLRINVENLTYTGTGDFVGIGNASDNIMTGGTGDDFLSGLDGDDVLTGGAGLDLLIGGNGADTFRIADSANRDRILDFASGVDKIALFGTAFVHSATVDYVAGTLATSSNSTFLYNSANGVLSYDADGAGSGAALAIANVGGGASFVVGDFLFY